MTKTSHSGRGRVVAAWHRAGAYRHIGPHLWVSNAGAGWGGIMVGT
jgi:hypothetical protein